MHLVILALMVSQSQMGHTDASAEGDLANFGLDNVELGEVAAKVRGECAQHLTVLGQCDQAMLFSR